MHSMGGQLVGNRIQETELASCRLSWPARCARTLSRIPRARKLIFSGSVLASHARFSSKTWSAETSPRLRRRAKSSHAKTKCDFRFQRGLKVDTALSRYSFAVARSPVAAANRTQGR